jgi:hypothetical protein
MNVCNHSCPNDAKTKLFFHKRSVTIHPKIGKGGPADMQWNTKGVGTAVLLNGTLNDNRETDNNWVWSPQGVIDMHKPENWGFLQFRD